MQQSDGDLDEIRIYKNWDTFLPLFALIRKRCRSQTVLYEYFVARNKNLRQG